VVPWLRSIADPSDNRRPHMAATSGFAREHRAAVKGLVRGWGAWGSNPEPTVKSQRRARIVPSGGVPCRCLPVRTRWSRRGQLSGGVLSRRLSGDAVRN